MVKNTETFESLIGRMEAAAEQSGFVANFWRQMSLVLIVWDDVKRGWMPTSQFDPRFHAGLGDLAAAYSRFGSQLVVAVNQRAFA